MTVQAEISELKAVVASLQAEVRLLLRGRGRADEESIEELMAYIHSEFQSHSWTADDIIQESKNSPFLAGALKRCLGKRLSLKKLSVWLNKSLGQAGHYSLECIDDHTRDGRLFVVTKFVTSSQSKDDRVRKTKEARV